MSDGKRSMWRPFSGICLSISISFSVVSFAAFAQGHNPAGTVAARPSTNDGVVLPDSGTEFVPEPNTEAVPRRGVAGNEAAVVNVCVSYIEAQLLYFRTDHKSDGFLTFAQKIRSTPGTRDGLFWPIDSDEDESPIGPLFAAAAITEYPFGEARPYFGYYFKILMGQGPEAPGGARDYRVDGRLIAGFALVAWPAAYGVSGVHSFMVNHLGDVYAKDLGPDTHRVAVGMPVFAPDRTWMKVISNPRTER
jgi:DUF2950 family protein